MYRTWCPVSSTQTDSLDALDQGLLKQHKFLYFQVKAATDFINYMVAQYKKRVCIKYLPNKNK